MINREPKPYIVVAAGTLIMFLLGAAYVWGVYTVPLKETFGWSKSQTALPFSIFLLTYTVSMIIGGRLQDRYGPTWVCTVGAVLFGGGYFLSGFANSLAWLIFSYGILGGFGTGFAYVTPVATNVKWFPHRKGLVSGITVFGFGAGAFLLSPITRWLISVYSWQMAFWVLGGVFLFLSVLLSRLIVLPDERWKEKLANTSLSFAKSEKPLMELTPREVVRNRLFLIAWIVWFFNLTVGLGTMGHIVSYAVYSGIDKMTGAIILSVIAIFNGFGRVIFGALSDRVGRLIVLAGASITLSIVSFLLIFAGGNVFFIYVLGALFGMAFGTCLVLYPTTAADLFGSKHLGVNYGLLFSSYGVGGFVGPLVYGRIFDTMKSYIFAFGGAAVVCLISAILAMILRNMWFEQKKRCQTSPSV